MIVIINYVDFVLIVSIKLILFYMFGLIFIVIERGGLFYSSIRRFCGWYHCPYPSFCDVVIHIIFVLMIKIVNMLRIF